MTDGRYEYYKKNRVHNLIVVFRFHLVSVRTRRGWTIEQAMDFFAMYLFLLYHNGAISREDAVKEYRQTEMMLTRFDNGDN